MADGKEPRKHNAAYSNTASAQAYENAMDDWVLQTAVNRQATDMLNQQRKDDYNFQNEMFNFNMDEQIRAYEHSKNIFDRNSEAVDMEVQFQKDQIYSNADSRLQELQYQQGDLDAAYARDSINNSFNAANLSIAAKQNQLEQQARTDLYGTNLALNSFNQQARSDLYGTNVALNALNQQARTDQFGSNLALNILNQQARTNQFGANMAMNTLSQQARTDQFKTQLKINSFDQQLRTDAFNTNMLLNDQEVAQRNNQFGTEMKAQSRQISKEQAEGRVEILKASLAADASEATSRASGKRGQSASLQAKAIQTAASINQGALMDQLNRGFGSFADVTTSLITSKRIGDKTSDIQRDQLQKTYKTESAINKANRDQLKKAYGTESEMSRVEREQLQNQYGTDSQMSEVEREQLINSYGTDSEISATERAQLDKKFSTDTKISQTERSQLQKSYSTETQVNKNQGKKIENDIQQQAALFGLTVEEYEADTEKLGRMMVDTYSGIQGELDRLAQQEFQTRTELYSMMPLPPSMPPRAKPPQEIPYEKLAKPTPAPFMDKNTMATMPQPQKQSGMGTFLSIAGMLVAGAGSVMTAGAGAGVMAAGAATWGAGLSAGGSILGGLGSRL